jgi:NADPH:quinone reductase-like Zn-dependent oxidoreductase
MKAAIIRAHGGLDAIRIEQVPDPTPGPDDALIEVRACALNHMDLWARKGIPGFKFPLPLIPGCDISGVVVKAKGFEPGAEVVLQPGLCCGTCPQCNEGNDHLCPKYGILGETRDGGCAERICVPLANLVPKPPNLSFEEAAAYPLTMLTAWHMLVARANVQADDKVLVHAAGSGVGSAAVQIAKLFGATVFATAGSRKKCDLAVELGAEIAVNYRDNPDWSKYIYQLTNKVGMDIVIEHVGKATFEGSLRCLRPGGRLVTCGATTGGQVDLNINRLFFKNLSVLGSTMGTMSELHDITRHVTSGDLKPVVDRVFELNDIREAHRVLEAREAFGKIVVRMP